MTARSMKVDEIVVNLHRCLRGNDVNETLKWYETLTGSPSLSLPRVQKFVRRLDRDNNVCCLYHEIWYRNHFAASAGSSPSPSPTMKDRVISWTNYSLLLDQVLPEMSYLHLPCQWLWDLVDEFVNQFQSFCEIWALETISDRDFTQIKLRHESWSVRHVISLLDALIKNSGISQILQQAKNDGGHQLLTAAENGDHPSSMMVLGYFSMAALSRVHCLLGSYQEALDCLLPIDIGLPGSYSCLVATRVTIIYHYGFASLMLGRYVDAICELNKILVYIFKTKQNEKTLNKIEQTYALLAICLSLCPSHLQPPDIDENVKTLLMERYGEKMSRLQQCDGEDAAVLYGELLSCAWPACSTPFVPNYGDPRDFFTPEELAYYGQECLADLYPDYFGPSAPSNEPPVNHNQLEALIGRILRLSLE